MKVFTHNLVIYHNGWCWKWEKKKENKGIQINGHEVILWAAIIMLLFGG